MLAIIPPLFIIVHSAAIETRSLKECSCKGPSDLPCVCVAAMDALQMLLSKHGFQKDTVTAATLEFAGNQYTTQLVCRIWVR